MRSSLSLEHAVYLDDWHSVNDWHHSLVHVSGHTVTVSAVALELVAGTIEAEHKASTLVSGQVSCARETILLCHSAGQYSTRSKVQMGKS